MENDSKKTQLSKKATSIYKRYEAENKSLKDRKERNEEYYNKIKFQNSRLKRSLKNKIDNMEAIDLYEENKTLIRKRDSIEFQIDQTYEEFDIRREKIYEFTRSYIDNRKKKALINARYRKGISDLKELEDVFRRVRAQPTYKEKYLAFEKRTKEETEKWNSEVLKLKETLNKRNISIQELTRTNKANTERLNEAKGRIVSLEKRFIDRCNSFNRESNKLDALDQKISSMGYKRSDFVDMQNSIDKENAFLKEEISVKSKLLKEERIKLSNQNAINKHIFDQALKRKTEAEKHKVLKEIINSGEPKPILEAKKGLNDLIIIINEKEMKINELKRQIAGLEEAAPKRAQELEFRKKQLNSELNQKKNVLKRIVEEGSELFQSSLIE